MFVVEWLADWSGERSEEKDMEERLTKLAEKLSGL